MNREPRANTRRYSIASDGDILRARQEVRALALELGFPLTETIGIVTALSEMARNMLLYAGHGELSVVTKNSGGRHGLELVARDEGPGIPDIQRALLDGYSTSGGLGMGLPGIKRLMDEFDIVSELQKGTTVTAVKWLERNSR